MIDSDQLRARTLAMVAREPSPTRRQHRQHYALLYALAAATALAVFAIVGGVRPDGRPTSLMVATAAGSAMLAAGALVLALGRGGSMLGRSPRLLLAVVVLLPLGFLAWRFGLSALYPGMTAAWPERPGYKCLGLTLAAALLPVAVSLVARRGTDPVHPGTTGAAIGAACGLAGAVLVDLWCPVSYLGHLLIGHLLPVAVLAAAGAIVGARLLAVGRR